jgi:hypothetical protein
MDENRKKELLEKAKSYHDAIAQILMDEWDPIGVKGIPEAHDEYDAYVGQVYGLLARRRPVHEVSDLLWWVETEHMGLRGNRTHTQQVAERLIGLVQQLSD